ncbi:sensor histidine kinase [Glutamicibacter protophormiae]|uniref:sensor histidine kinase n=1 Tax=Glutamicibacter protophormiae TaxID=37930 RepID=UPI00195E14E7|nr:histidine kinase [Glutamicibacter protophormiae]QRQ79346.1 hypothetical protein JQN66_03725 [Glutamicibacter protophormiae]
MTTLIRRLGSGQNEPETAGMYLLLAAVLHAFGVVNPPLAGLPGWLWLPALLLGLGAILLRRRWLLPAVLVMAVSGLGLLALGSIAGYFMVFEAVFSVFLLGGMRLRRISFALMCLVALVMALLAWDATQAEQQVVLSLFLTGFILFTPMLWAQNVRTAQDLAHSQAERSAALAAAAEARAERLSAEHHAARISERTALAREMHDVLSARLSSIALLSGAALATAPGNEPLAAIRRESVTGLEEMSEMVRMLHAGTPALAARLTDVPQLVAQAPEEVELEYSVPHPEGIPAAVHTAGHRTVRELLVNHAKHAPGSVLRLRLQQLPDRVQIYASNPVALQAGHGFGSGIGLMSIRTRAQAVGGSMDVSTTPEFKVQVVLPTAVQPEDEIHEDPAC